MCANFCLNAHTLCAKLSLNAQSLGDSMILGKAQSSTYFYCGLLRDLTVGILRYGGLSVGGLSLATCSVLHTARLLHARGIGVGGRASVYGESQGSGNGSIYLAAASFSRVFTFYILIQLLTPWEAKSKCKSAIFCRIFPSALGRTWPAITTDQCRGEKL